MTVHITITDNNWETSTKLVYTNLMKSPILKGYRESLGRPFTRNFH